MAKCNHLRPLPFKGLNPGNSGNYLYRVRIGLDYTILLGIMRNPQLHSFTDVTCRLDAKFDLAVGTSAVIQVVVVH